MEGIDLPDMYREKQFLSEQSQDNSRDTCKESQKYLLTWLK